MVILNRDGSLLETFETQRGEDNASTCYAEIAAETLDDERSLFDRIIGLAFDVFGARRLDVRVYEDEA